MRERIKSRAGLADFYKAAVRVCIQNSLLYQHFRGDGRVVSDEKNSPNWLA